MFRGNVRLPFNSLATAAVAAAVAGALTSRPAAARAAFAAADGGVTAAGFVARMGVIDVRGAVRPLVTGVDAASIERMVGTVDEEAEAGVGAAIAEAEVDVDTGSTAGATEPQSGSWEGWDGRPASPKLALELALALALALAPAPGNGADFGADAKMASILASMKESSSDKFVGVGRPTRADVADAAAGGSTPSTRPLLISGDADHTDVDGVDGAARGMTAGTAGDLAPAAATAATAADAAASARCCNTGADGSPARAGPPADADSSLSPDAAA